MNKKYIIILGTVFIVLIISLGFITYYEQRKNNLDFLADLKSANTCEDLLEGQQYVVCCVHDGKFYDCSEREYFNSDEEVKIIVDPLKIPAIESLSSFNYACLGTDISRKTPKGEIVFLPEECFTFDRESLFEINGVIPPIDNCMLCRRVPNDPYGVFTLLRINLYPDPSKEIFVIYGNEEETMQSDHFTVFNLKSRISDQ